MLYVPDLVKSEQDQASYFEEGLRNEIRERMIVIGREPHKEVQPKKGKDSMASGSTTSAPITSSRPLVSQTQQRPPRFSRSEITTSEKSSGGSDKCRHCGKYHIRLFVPSPSARTNIQRKDSTEVQPRQGVTIQSDVESNIPAYPHPRPQTRTSTRVFAIAKDEARVQPRENE
ncbi:Gag protease polyprotein, putative [Theobroma cacao]|uniref:Gag protease polyprotein, putative n=1 Tax=Theobroma cacao TaxID=3641 RepID=A0A061GQA6_THECC|nr:Gag protease polyprotein, putative [Theobroma cacao]